VPPNASIYTLLDKTSVHRVRLGDRVDIEIPALPVVYRDRLWGTVESVAAEPTARSSVLTNRVDEVHLAPDGYRVGVAFNSSDDSLRKSLRRGYPVRARIVTRSSRIAVLLRDYLRETIGGRG
jgi:hypothetical protein